MSFFKKFWAWFSAPTPSYSVEEKAEETAPVLLDPLVPTPASIQDVPADTFSAQVEIESVVKTEYADVAAPVNVEPVVKKSRTSKKPAAITPQKKLPVQKKPVAKPAAKKSPQKKKTGK